MPETEARQDEMMRDAVAYAHVMGEKDSVYRVNDAWGGYYQTVSEWGIYNFRLKG